jgi:superfamily I DNA/RNA helicase
MSNALCYGEPWAIGDAAIPCRKGATEDLGVVEVQQYDDGLSMVSGTAADIKQRFDAGAPPTDFAILCPTNAQCMTYSVALFHRNVPARVMGLSYSFYSTPIARQILRICALCTDYDFQTLDQGPGATFLRTDLYVQNWLQAITAGPSLTRLPFVKAGFKYLSMEESETARRKRGDAPVSKPYLAYILEEAADRTAPHESQARFVIAVLRRAAKHPLIARGRDADRWGSALNGLSNLLEKCVSAGWPKMLDVIKLHAYKDPTRQDKEDEEITGDDSSDAEIVGTLCAAFGRYADVSAIFKAGADIAASLKRDSIDEQRGKTLAGAVIISTVHKFKGLQAKNIYAPISRGSYGELRVEDAEEAAEKQRLLYVTVSRPMDRVVLTYANKDDQGRALGMTELAAPILRYLSDARRGILDWPIMRPLFEQQLGGGGYALATTYADLRQGLVRFTCPGKDPVEILEMSTGVWSVTTVEKTYGEYGALRDVLRYADIAMNGTLEDPIDDFIRYLRQVGTDDSVQVAAWVAGDLGVRARLRGQFAQVQAP